MVLRYIQAVLFELVLQLVFAAAAEKHVQAVDDRLQFFQHMGAVSNFVLLNIRLCLISTWPGFVVKLADSVSQSINSCLKAHFSDRVRSALKVAIINKISYYNASVGMSLTRSAIATWKN